MPSRSRRSRSVASIASRAASSSAEVGSSSSRTRGSSASARASIARCCSPTESLAASRSANDGVEAGELEQPRGRRARHGRPSSCGGEARCCPRPCRRAAPAAAARARPRAAARAGRARARRRRGRRTVPASGSASRLSSRSRLDLPQPGRPGDADGALGKPAAHVLEDQSAPPRESLTSSSSNSTIRLSGRVELERELDRDDGGEGLDEDSGDQRRDDVLERAGAGYERRRDQVQRLRDRRRSRIGREAAWPSRRRNGRGRDRGCARAPTWPPGDVSRRASARARTTCRRRSPGRPGARGRPPCPSRRRGPRRRASPMAVSGRLPRPPGARPRAAVRAAICAITAHST